jgi:hypothetical protein
MDAVVNIFGFILITVSYIVSIVVIFLISVSYGYLDIAVNILIFILYAINYFWIKRYFVGILCQIVISVHIIAGILLLVIGLISAMPDWLVHFLYEIGVHLHL